MESYNHKDIEKKWQDKWQSDGIYNIDNKVEGKENFYQLVEFTYPSGNLHVGHWYAFAVPDIFARYKRMQGFNVLYPMGFDAFGLPAENAAIKLGADPKVWTYEQMEKMRAQFRTMGAVFPWDREVVSCDPEYYKWTQWMFNQFLKNDLVYRANTKVNWCPKDQTILANEQVVDNKCERCGAEVVQRDQEQWMIRITKYADRLIDDLDALAWPDAIKDSQKNWIGRSEGSEISFKLKVESGVVSETFKFRPELVELIKKGEKNVTFRMEQKNVSIGDTVSLIDWADGNKENQKEFLKARITKISEFKLIDLPLDYPGHEKDSSAEERLVRYQGYYGNHITNESIVYIYEFETLAVSVFTTRADTLFGVTYVVLAPENSLVQSLKSQIENWDEVEGYITETKKKSELDRQQSKEKTGVELKGIKAINPANGEEVPVWIADYVLAGYGTGAVMAVPAHDERDWEFANKYDLPIKEVVRPYVVDTVNVPREDKKTVIRRNVHAIVFDPKNKKYLILRNPKHDWDSLVIGGVEEGEDLVDTAIREIKEETGYTNVTYIRSLGFPVQAGYFAKHKDENRLAIASALYFELAGGEKIEIPTDGENEGNEILWIDPSDFTPGKMINSELPFWLERMKHPGDIAYTDEGILTNSHKFDDMTTSEARQKITEFVGGKMVKTYRLRDWGISRQRYWGCPIPIVYDPEGNAHAVPDEHLPWILPTDVDHTPDGTAPLARSRELFERTEKIFGAGWKPEVETMDTFVDSSWYFYRYLDNKNNKEFASLDKMDAWMPIDLYMGGAEHTTMHLLYSRFWTKALYDLGFVKDSEAYKIRRNRGLILGPDGNKMSKSKGNVIDPDEIVDRLGADTVRMYLAFMGPYGITTNYPWDPNGVVGVRRFIERVFRLKDKISDDTESIGALLHKVIKKVTEDVEGFKFNTAISQMMILVNDFEKKDQILSGDYKILLKLLSPFAPHIAEEIWYQIGEKESIHLSEWPKYDESKLTSVESLVVVQINGKVRSQVMLANDASEEEAVSIAKQDEKVKKWLGESEIKKTIYITGKIINFVV